MRVVPHFKIALLLLIPGLVTLAACSDQSADNTTVAVSEPQPAMVKETTQDLQAEPLSGNSTAVYAYSMLSAGKDSTPVIFARLVYDALNQPCPVLSGDDGSSVTTTTRPANPVSGGAVVSAVNFPVSVCEAVIQPGVAYSNSTDGISLAAVSLQPMQVQVYGDSGCEEADCPAGAPSTQFQLLADLGAARTHQLILHMGDFNYRGTGGHFARSASGHNIYAYDAGDVPNPQPACSYTDTYYSQNSLNSPKPDIWANWQADFFEAAKTLLPTAPWVFARGNHELCSRAGVGWYYFLGPGSSLPGSGLAQMQCPDQGDLNNPPKIAAQHVDINPAYMLGLDKFQLYVMDSANACDTFHGNPLTEDYQAQYTQLESLAGNGKPTWLMSHRPIWGYQGGGSSLNNMLQTAISNTSNKKLPDAVTLSLAGHMHIYESLTFFDANGKPTGRPPQLVVGNSGVALGGAPGSGSGQQIDGEAATYNSEGQQFGFLQMALGDMGGWSGQMITTDGSTIRNCNSANPSAGQPICQ